ncbi:MAG TPA: amino acid adenylation domain-containing protein [Longimicrobium sp.]|nr:amino acid adenylation domain-containing protein [Longimicrobium sp.]
MDPRADIPIGLPLADARIHLLDADLQPVAAGEEGELFVGGARLARGYLGRPGLTAAFFLPDPFSTEPGARMYRTGDRARWPEGGEIDFLGRIDEQVKVGGFRVEPAEVEAVLASHPEVADGAVVARADEAGRTRLFGYYVAVPGAELTERELRAHLRRRLPPYMVPSALVALPELPLSPNGKVDRRALPAPAAVQAGDDDFVAPRTPTQAVLAEIWSDVLGVERVGEYDHFFELGGHSLLGMQVMTRIRQLFGAELPVRTLFEAPRLAMMAERIDEALGVEGVPEQPALVPARRDTALPLSFAQARLWFLHQLEPDSPFYNIPAAVRLEGKLDVEALRRTLEEVVRRHEPLRTVFHVRNGEPVQVVRPAGRFHLPVHDLRVLPAEWLEAEVSAIADEEAARRFDLERDVTLRGTLIRLRDAEHVLLLNLHHIAGDGWSLGVLFHEIGKLYEAFASGAESPLAPLPVQYADYAVWQRKWLSDETLEKQLAYWSRRLGDAPPALELPTDRPRPPVQTHQGAVHHFTIPADLAARVRAFARREGATLYMVLLAALDTLLHRWSGQDDIVVGSPIAGRVRRELEGLIGFFVNTMALRVDLSGDPSFHDLLARVRETTLDAYAHQDLPFERIVEALQPERSLARSPIFQVSFVLQNAPTPPVELPGLRLRLQDLSSGTSKFDLSVELREVPEGLAGEAEFATALFDRETVARMMKQLQAILAAVVADPSTPVSRIPLLPSGERVAVLRMWPEGDPARPIEAVHRRFARAAAADPLAPALECDGRTVSFGELDARANRIARLLRGRGVGPETRVGVFSERTPEMVAGILGVLKAGAAYVPLDPKYPRGRLEYMLQDSGVPFVLALDRILDRLPPSEAEVISLDGAWSAGGDASDPEVEIDPRTVAYVIYTSGSTGRPKGVLVPHSGVSAYLGWAVESYRLGGEGAPVHSPLAFDLTVTSLFVPLLRGERVVLVPDAGGVEGLAAALRANPGMSLVKLTPTHLSLLRNQLGDDAARVSPKAFVIGGENLEAEVAAYWLTAAPGTALINEYGPTEATVGCCIHRVSEYAPHHGSVPIGQPTPGTRLFVLDRHLEAVPVGVAGELYIGGAQLARGYLGRPDLTAERFVPDLYADGPGARMYRTGDRARWLADGTLEFLGRLDDQVKIRGHRIEPAEIETVLAQHPEVSDAAVEVREDGSGGKRLVGYVVPAPYAEEEAPAVVEASPEASPEYGEDRDAQVSQWETVFEGMYGGGEAEDVTFNIVGWNSSYTGEAIPPEEMREWVDRTAERILSLQPSRVLEIGVGSGLFLFRVAPHASLYVGADLSSNAIQKLSEALPKSGLRLPPVKLLNRPADDLSGLQPREFDTVVINSVIQYFPSPSYLAGVLEGAVERVRDGGAIFVGDVRALETVSAFHAGTELMRAADTATAAELRARIRRRGEEEEELVLDPRFFAALKERVPRISRVDVRVKRGVHHNELSRHRYDVILHVGPAPEAPVAAREAQWGTEVKSVEGLRAILEAGGAPLRLHGVPNARVAAELRMLELLESEDAPENAAALRAELARVRAVDPEEIWRLGESLGLKVEVQPTPGAAGRFDAAFVPADFRGSPFAPLPSGGRPPRAWANDPRRGARIRALVPKLRAFLRDHLPEYMVPAAVVVMESFPLTENGKTDRRALPDPETPRAASDADYVAPRTETEAALCGMWAELLRVERVGVEDNFFDLGGHSLLATVLVSRIREQMQLEVPLHRVFQTPTVAGLAGVVEELNQKMLEKLLAELDGLSDEDAAALLALEAETFSQ